MSTTRQLLVFLSCVTAVPVLILSGTARGAQQGTLVHPKDQSIKSLGLEDDPEDLAQEHYRVGSEYLKDPLNTELAVDHLEKAVELDKTNAEYRFKLAEAYAEDFTYANILRKPFLAAKVKTQLELAVKFNPSSIVYREGLIQYLVLAPALLGGSYSDARKHADAMKEYDPYFSILANAMISAEEGNHEKAVMFYTRAIQIRPHAWQAYQRYGAYSMNTRQFDLVIELYKKYVDVAPDTSFSHESLAGAYVRKRMYDEAIASYKGAVEVDPRLAHLVFRIAQLYEFKGMRREALSYYEYYLEAVPNGPLSADARTKIGELKKN